MQARNTKAFQSKNKDFQDSQIGQNKSQDIQLQQKQRNTSQNQFESQLSYGDISLNQNRDQIKDQQNFLPIPTSKQTKELQRKQSQIGNKNISEQPNGPDDPSSTFQKQRKRDSVQTNSTHQSELNDKVIQDYNLNKNVIKARQSIFRASQAFQTSESKNQGELVIEIERLKTTLLVLNQKIKDQDDWEDQIKKLRARNFEFEEQSNIDKNQIQYLEAENLQLKNQLEELNQDIVDLRKQSDEEIVNLKYKYDIEIINLKQRYDQEISDLKKQINSTKKENQDYKLENSNLKSEILSLKSQLATALNNLENYKQRYNDLNQQHEEVHDQKINIKYDNEDLNSKIVSLEEDLYESKTIQLDLLEQLKLLESQLHQAETQLHQAETKIQELLDQNEQLAKMQAIYIGHRKDKVDIVLGNFINTFPEREKMKILFLRESEGVYQFGQKRVYIKIGKGNQLVVRVGGGYMLIQDFIEQYTSQEVDRIQRTDVISRFQNKLSLQNITTKADYSYEVSPVRSPKRKDQNLQRSNTSKSPVRSQSRVGVKTAISPLRKSQLQKSVNNSPRKN